MRISSVALMAAVASAQSSNSASMPPGTFGLANSNTTSSTACADVHYIVVRASTEPPGQGVIGSLATISSSSNQGSTVEALDYPAVLSPYNVSSYNGTMTLTTRLRDYVDSCARSRIVLLGYSQGAHVIGDVLCGGGGSPALGPASAPIESKYVDQVAAVVQMGDPRFVAGKEFDAGNSTMNGIYARPANISCDKYASKIKSYCDADDLFCASGNSIGVHVSYTRRYNDDANKFIADKLKQAASGSSSSGAGAGSQSSAAGRHLLQTHTTLPWAFAILAFACTLL